MMPSSNVTNGHTNGHTNGTTINTKDIPATKLLASFVANATTQQLNPTIRDKVKEVLVDYIGVVSGALDNADSTEPIYRAIIALQGFGISGNCTVIGKGAPHMLPQYAGLLNSAFGHSLDFDDTYIEGTLHAGVSAISAAMTQAEVLGNRTSSEEFMLAVSVGYEVTARLGRELGLEAYERGMHNTGTAGIFGSIAAISVLKRLSAETVEMAFGLAGSKAAGSMQYLDNGSWNKRLHPGFAVHDAFMCVALAESGVIGASRIIEGKMGFLQAYSPKKDKDLQRLTTGLGTEWAWIASSLKPWSACRMTHTFIEIAGDIHDERGGKISAADVRTITLMMEPPSFLLVGDPTTNKIHPSNVIDAQFSAYFQTAYSLVYGSNTGLEAYKKLNDPDVYELCGKTNVVIDDGLKGFAATVRIEWANGEIEEKTQRYPLGEQQHPFTRERVDEKFLSLATPVFGKEKAQNIVSVVDELEGHSVEELIKLLR